MSKILAIDDNSDNLIILKALIQDAFIESVFYPALNGPTGIELAIEVDPDVILLDIVMPEMDGFEVCRRLKEIDKVCDIPVIFLTAIQESRDTRIKALEIGAEAILTKPIDEIELIAQIRAMVKIKAANYSKRSEQERLEKLVRDRTMELEQSHIEMLCLLNDLRAENEARIKIETALRESEQKYRQLYECAGVGIGYYTIDGLVISYNQLRANYQNGKPTDFEGKSVYNILSKPDADFLLERIRIAADLEAIQEYDDYITLPSGSKWFHTIYTRIQDSTQKVLGVQVISTDITEQKTTEQELRQNELRLNRAELASKSGNWELHLDSGKMIASEGAAKIYGVLNEEFEYEYVKNIPLPEYRPILDAAIKNLISGHKSYQLEFKIKAVDSGKIKDIQSVATYDRENRIVYGVIQDITARKAVEMELTRSEILNRSLVEHLPQRIFIKDINSTYLSCNANYANDLGITPEQIVGKTDIEFVPAQLADAYRADDRTVMETGRLKNIVEPYLLGGVEHWIQTTKVPYHDEQGKIIGVLGIFDDISVQRKQQEALKNSEERFKNIYVNSPIAIELYNEKGSLVDVNPACCTLFGIKSVDEVRGFRLFDDPNIPSDQKELLIKGLHISYEAEFDFDLVKKHNLYPTSRSGKVSLDVQVTPIRKGEQNIFDYLVQIIDITERKRAEELLQAEQSRIKAITMTAQDGILMMDPHGNIQFFNPAAEKILGYSCEEVIGKNLHGLFAPPQYHTTHNQAYTSFLKTGAGNAIGKNVELEALCKDGSLIDIELSLSALEFPDGWYAIGILRDITEKKATGRRIKLLAHSLESISECVTITNSNDMIIYVNNSLLKTYGYSENELIGQHINILRPDELKNKRARDIFSEIPYRGWRGEIMNKRKNGQIFPILLSTSSIKDENNNEIAMIGVAIDITEIRKNREELIAAKEKAEESNKLKTAFLATMNHELRTPLNHILGFSDLILSDATFQECKNYAKFINQSGKNLLSIVEDVFDLALVENENIKLRNQTYSLVDHFMESKASFDEILKNSSKHEHISLVYKPDTNCLQDYVTADRSKINQVLTNLFKNAIKFTQYGTIEFGYRFDNKSNLSYYVTDTGIGIPQDKQDIIFDFFRQVDDTVTRSYGGIGIGLAISLKIAKILKGELSVVSEPGKGSTFTLTIPVIVPDI
ncbi:MAG: PAS domain S-box protein [Mariniphaga sp.]